jgi:Thoeris protein ThsB, TIR-like domain
MPIKHKVFISYHHANDQVYKNQLQSLNHAHDLFTDMSVDTGDIDEDLDDEAIRTKIRDDYLKDSTVTIVLVGLETKNRKHIDWEIYSSMYNGAVNRQSGILVIHLPTTGTSGGTAAHGQTEKLTVYPEVTSWISISGEDAYKSRYPYAPHRIIENLAKSGVRISVADWDRVTRDPEKLRCLIDLAFDGRVANNYELSTPMRRRNS